MEAFLTFNHGENHLWTEIKLFIFSMFVGQG